MKNNNKIIMNKKWIIMIIMMIKIMKWIMIIMK